MSILKMIQNFLPTNSDNQIINPETKSGNIDMSNSTYAHIVNQYVQADIGKILMDKVSNEKINFKILQIGSFWGTERPLPVTKIASRKELVDKLIRKLKNTNWIHIYGSLWSGKTQLLYLLSEKVLDFSWLNLDEFSDDNIVVYLKLSMQCIANKSAKTTQEIIDNYVCSISEKSVLFVDGILPKHINSNEFLSLLGALYKSCNNKDIKLVTSGYCDLYDKLDDYICNSDIYTESISGLSLEDIIELLEQYEAPKDKNLTHIAKLLEVYGKESPGLIVEAIKDTKFADWEIDDNFWNKIFSSNIGSLEDRLEQLLVSKLNEEERTLLFRISYIGHNFPDNIILKLSYVNPAISDFMKIKLQLYNRWIQKDTNIIKSNKLYNSIAEKNLSSEEKLKVDEIIVEYYYNLKSIDQIDFINLSSHLIKLEKFDEVGQLYAQMLDSMIKQNIFEEQFCISSFWNELPLPVSMATEVKLLVRIQQVRYLAFMRKDTSIPLLDLVEIVNKTQIGGEYILFLIGMSNMEYKIVSLCFETALKNICLIC